MWICTVSMHRWMYIYKYICFYVYTDERNFPRSTRHDTANTRTTASLSHHQAPRARIRVRNERLLPLPGLGGDEAAADADAGADGRDGVRAHVAAALLILSTSTSNSNSRTARDREAVRPVPPRVRPVLLGAVGAEEVRRRQRRAVATAVIVPVGGGGGAGGGGAGVHLQLAPARAPAPTVRGAVLPPQLDALAHQAEPARLALLRVVRTPAVPAHAARPHLGCGDLHGCGMREAGCGMRMRRWIYVGTYRCV